MYTSYGSSSDLWCSWQARQILLRNLLWMYFSGLSTSSSTHWQLVHLNTFVMVSDTTEGRSDYFDSLIMSWTKTQKLVCKETGDLTRNFWHWSFLWPEEQACAFTFTVQVSWLPTAGGCCNRSCVPAFLFTFPSSVGQGAQKRGGLLGTCLKHSGKSG